MKCLGCEADLDQAHFLTHIESCLRLGPAERLIDHAAMMYHVIQHHEDQEFLLSLYTAGIRVALGSFRIDVGNLDERIEERIDALFGDDPKEREGS